MSWIREMKRVVRAPSCSDWYLDRPKLRGKVIRDLKLLPDRSLQQIKRTSRSVHLSFSADTGESKSELQRVLEHRTLGDEHESHLICAPFLQVDPITCSSINRQGVFGMSFHEF